MEQEQSILSKEISNLSLTIALLNRTLDALEARMINHVNEGERPGGHRDRLLLLEKDHDQVKVTIAEVKRDIWKMGFLSGIIGGLIGKLTPELLNILVNQIK